MATKKPGMKKRLAMGIDPGLSGALVLLLDGEFYDAARMPVENKKSGKKQVSAKGLKTLADLISTYVKANDAKLLIALEQVQPMPAGLRGGVKPSMSSSFSMGDSYACARFFATLLEGELHLVPPARWKAEMRLNRDKNFSLAEARRLYPAAEAWLRLKKDSDVAEALLLARYAHTRLV